MSKLTIYSLDTLLSQFGTSPLFYFQFILLLLDLHTDFQKAGQMVWYSHLLKNFPQFFVIYTVKGFVIVSEVDDFLEISSLAGGFLTANATWRRVLIYTAALMNLKNTMLIE